MTRLLIVSICVFVTSAQDVTFRNKVDSEGATLTKPFKRVPGVPASCSQAEEGSFITVIGAGSIHKCVGGEWEAISGGGPGGGVTSVEAGTGLTGGTITDNGTIAADLASQVDAETGSNNTKLMTPLRVAQAIAELAIGGTPATQSEAALGVDNTKMMTPLRTSDAITARFPPMTGNGGLVFCTDGSNLVFCGYPLKDYVAARIQGTIASAGFSFGATAQPTASPIAGTNTPYAVLQFADDADQYAYDEFQLPLGTLPPISVSFSVSTDTTSTAAVKPSIAIKCVARFGGNPDAAYGTAQTVSITPTGTVNYPVTGVVALNLAGCSAGDLLQFRLGTDRTDASTAKKQMHQVTFYVPAP